MASAKQSKTLVLPVVQQNDPISYLANSPKDVKRVFQHAPGM